TTPPPPPSPSPSPSSQFGAETTDAQTNIRDSAQPPPLPREFDEAVPTLAPLEKTGAVPSMDESSSRQDESGAVTLAHGLPGERAVDTPPPSLPMATLPPIPI